MAIQKTQPMGGSKLLGVGLGALTGGTAGAGSAAISGTPAGNLLAMQRMLDSKPEPEKPGLNYTYGKDALDRRFGLLGGG